MLTKFRSYKNVFDYQLMQQQILGPPKIGAAVGVLHSSNISVAQSSSLMYNSRRKVGFFETSTDNGKPRVRQSEHDVVQNPPTPMKCVLSFKRAINVTVFICMPH